jgi:hypothetical protein
VIGTDSVTACLVTRGDQPDKVAEIIDSLIFWRVIVWDNSEREDLKCAGRFAAAREAFTDVVYFQDDDVLVPAATQRALLEAYEPGMVVANYGHGENDGGYGDLPLVCGGAVADKSLFPEAMNRYLEHWPQDDDFLYYADFAVGVLVPFKHIYEPFEIDYPIAQHPSRLCNQPWAAEAKQTVTQRARAVRDGLLEAA